MRSIMKLCGVLAVFVLSVMANPLISELNERTRSSGQDLQPDIDGYMNDDGEVTDQSQATTAVSISIPPENEVVSETIAAAANPSTQQENEPKSEADSQSTIAELSASSTIPKTDVPILKQDGEGGQGDEGSDATPPSTTTQSPGGTTTAKDSSSLTSPNKVMGIAALLTLLYSVKLYKTY